VNGERRIVVWRLDRVPMDELDTKSVDVSVRRAPEKMRRQDDGNEQENATCRRRLVVTIVS
jgi:hypothetical protein